jgi:extradiol dioxygenase family protein
MSTSKFHISLNVHDLGAASAFLEMLLDTKPAQLHSNYAKFELADPPLVLSLAPTDVPSGAGINHLGFRLPDREALNSMQDRLKKAGIAHEIEESIACCHSRQSKFWVHDPAGNLWEFYVLEEPGVEESKCEDRPQAPTIAAAHSTEPAAWGHRLGEQLPARFPFDDCELDKIVLEGTLNAELSQDQTARIMSEADRVLRDGGTLVIHGLAADEPLPARPKLPGPATAVEHVPTCREILDAVEAAGFASLELTTFGETYAFSYDGIKLREMRLRAFRGSSSSSSEQFNAIYRGPFAHVCDETGRVFRRGDPTPIDGKTVERLRNSDVAAQFIFEPVELVQLLT